MIKKADVRYFTYNSGTQAWSVSDLDNSLSTGNFADDSVADFKIANCPSADCFMLSTISYPADSGYTGLFWNGTNFTTQYAAKITSTVSSHGGSPGHALAFLFAPEAQVQGGGGSPDVTPPSITNLINSTTTNQSVMVTWATDESANESNTLGLCPSFTGIFSNKNNTLGISHIQSINGLSNSTNYCFNTTACDSSSNCQNFKVFS